MTYIDRFRRDRHQRLVLGSALLILAIVVSLSVYWQLRYTGITMTNETFCGYEEHVHTEECYEYTLVCGLEETEGHTHSEECYDEEGNLICELEESEPHTHTEECYEKTLICELSEHTHTVECLIDLNADVEDASIWEATLPELTGDIRNDVVSIAYSQLYYTESTANYSIGEDGITHYGYTRYGTWYGNSYADWDSMFAAFCLDYAGIEDEFTYNAGAYAWSVDLTNLGYYQTADSYTPSRGDIVFIDTDNDGKANVSAIVVSIDETAETITVIQGNYSVTDNDGNTTDIVAFVTYSTAVETVEEVLAESGIATLSAETEAIETEETEETEEITPVILGYADVTLTSEEEAEEIIDEEETEEVLDEDSTSETEEEIDLDGEESEEILEETEESDEPEELEEVEETEEADESEGETLLLTATSVDYVTQVTELYTIGMSLSAGDTSTAATIWDALMTIWEQIYAEEEAGTLTLTTEEYDNVNALTDEVYYYFVETVGYDPYGISTADDEGGEVASTNTAASTGNLYSSIVIDSSTNPATITKTAISNSEVSWSYSSASYTDGTISLDLTATFIISGGDLNDAGGIVYIWLSDDVTIDSSLIGGSYPGYTSDNELAFYYTYCYDDTTGTYYVKISFDSTYVANHASDTTITGYVQSSQFSYEYDEEDDDGTNVNISVDDEVILIIPISDITTTDNESLYQDLTLSKTATSYDIDSRSITYTVEISSKNGTGTITLEDLMSIVSNDANYSAASIYGITVESVTYATGVTNEWNQTSWTTVSDVTPVSDSSDVTSTAGSSYCADISTSGLTITLSPLSGGDEDTNKTYDTDRYTITYTVTFNEQATIDSTVTNDATATSKIDEDEIESEVTVVKNIVTTTIEKSGTYDKDTGLITWTITFNENGSDVTGYILSDTMFKSIVGKLGVTYTDSTNTTATDSDGSDYTYDSDNGTITFNAVDDSDGDGVKDNHRTYTITYTTDSGVSGFSGSSYYQANQVYVYKPDGGTGYDDSDTSTVKVVDGSDLAKEYTNVDKANLSNGTIDITWTSTLTVPKYGIDSGTVITDWLAQSWYGEWGKYSQGGYFTWTQLYDFLYSLMRDGLTDGSGTQYLDYDNGEGFTIEVYDTTDGWISYSTFESLTNPNEHTFTAYRITLKKDIDGPATIVLSYTSTADTSSITSSQTYYNTIQVGSLSETASYTETKDVYKTDGSGNTGTTTVNTTDGTVTWKVNIDLSDYTINSGELVITDTLPDGVSLVSVYVSMSNGNATLTPKDGSTSLEPSGTINGESIGGTAETDNSTGETKVVIRIPEGAYSKILTDSSSSKQITLTFTCQIKEWDTLSSSLETETTSGKYTVSTGETYTNSVNVWLGGTYLGDDEQTQNINYTYTVYEQSSSGTHDVVEKNGDYDNIGGNNYLTYEALINLDGNVLNNNEDLTFYDVLETYNTTSADLVVGSVKFYKLYKLSVVIDQNTNEVTDFYYVYTDENNNTLSLPITPTYAADGSYSNIYVYSNTGTGETSYYYKEEIDIAWDYNVYDPYSFSLYYSNNTSHVLSASVPDATPILVEYQYYFTSTVSAGTTVWIKNTAFINGTSGTEGKDDTEESTPYKIPTTSAGVYSSGGYTLIKSGQHTSELLSGAVFQLYVYDNDDTSPTYKTFIPAEYTYDEISNSEYGLVEGVDYIVSGSHYYVIYTSDTSGVISVVPYKEGNGTQATPYKYWDWYSIDTVCYLVEIEAPKGYILDSETKYYFYWATVDQWGNVTTNPAGYTSDMDIQNLSSDASSNYVSNAPITTFTLKKVQNGQTSTTLPGAEFYLYVYSGRDVSTGDDVWTYIGTYTTDDDGEISITFDDAIFDLDTAYMLKEVKAPDGYNVAYEDHIAFYFYWDEQDDNNGTYPSTWGTGSTDNGYSYETAANIAAQNVTVEATNTKTLTALTATKVWLDASGNTITPDSSYTATLELRYYISTVAPSSSSSTSTSTNVETTTLANVSVSSNNTISSSNTSVTWWNMTGLSLYNNITKYLASDTNSYLQITVTGASSTDNLSINLQDENNNVIGSLSVPTDSVYDTSTATYTLSYSYAYINSVLSANGKSLSNVSGFYITNGTNGSGGGTITNISVLSDYEVEYTSSESKSIGNSWNTFLTDESGAKAAITTDGALIRVNYTCTTAGDVMFAVVSGSNSSQAYATKTVSLTEGSSSFTVAVSDLYQGTGFDLDSYYQLAINSQNSNGYYAEATIDSIEILVPYTSSSSGSTTTTTTETLLTIVSKSSGLEITSTWHSGNNVLVDEYTSGITSWTDFYTYLTSDEDAYVEVVISGSSSATLEIQFKDNGSYPNVSVSGTYTIDSDGNYVYKFTASDILSTISSTVSSNPTYSPYKLCISGISDTATLISAAVKVDNEVNTSGSTVDASYYVTLYSWIPDGTETVTDESGNVVDLTGSNSSANGYYWNVVSTWEDDYVNIRALLDAIYGDLTSRVYITVETTDNGTIDAIKNKELYLIIQGDTSVGENGYDTILEISPLDYIDNGDGTYTLIYRSSQIQSLLSLEEAKYADAASVYADYLKLILSFRNYDGNSATLKSIVVETTNKLELSSTYSKSYLTGESTTNYLYTDGNGTGKYVLDSSNNWMVTVTDLPMSFTTTDSEGKSTTYYYYYYFVETGYTGGSTTYTTTYSQVDGENTGGEIVITNIETSYVLPSTGGIGTKTLYEFGILLILLALSGAGAYWNISRIRKSLVSEPLHSKVNPDGHDERLPDVRNRRFVIPRNARKGDTRAGPDDDG